DLIEKQPDKVKDLLDYLENKKKPIFERIVMYLLRFVPVGTEVDRINLILGVNNSLKRKAETKEYWYEYRLLLRDKFDEVNDIVKKQFEEWIKSLNEKNDIDNWNEWYEKHHKDKNREEFLRQYEARERARELYLARERYPELFKSILHEAGFKENDAAPQPSMWTPSHEEVHGVPEISADDPLWDEPNKAIDLLITKKEWSLKQKGWGHDSPEEEQAQIFREVLQAKFQGYFAIDPEKIARLPEPFLRRY
ncbi:MAG: hypothetical protein NT030_08085, partial [Candidatus Saganbacteria bacterium]|nr:hypothetical protein [Candidatus Saganbacteria bacterium]